MSVEVELDEVKAYLKNHPEFFEENATLLADIHLPSPHGSGTISLAERQQLAQRDKISVLENRFSELVLNAQENDAIANKIHAFNLRLHQAKNFDAIEQLISHDLPEFFDLSDTCLRIWVQPLTQASQANLVFSETSEMVKTWIVALTKPYCGKSPEIVCEDWFIDPPASLAIIPLHHVALFGFLALASDNENHFYSEMGTDFLNKIGELVSAALSRHLNVA
ncbi:MAG: DUF484 family protein [Pseudomonadota bacterium]